MSELLTEYFQLKLNPQQINEAAGSKPGEGMFLNGVVIQRANAKNRNGLSIDTNHIHHHDSNLLNKSLSPSPTAANRFLS